MVWAPSALHNAAPIKALLLLYLGVCTCQSAMIRSTECARGGCYSSSRAGFSRGFADSSIITALSGSVCMCVRERMSVMGLMTMKWGVAEY